MTSVCAPIELHTLDKAMRRGLGELVEKVTMAAVIDGDGRDLLLREMAAAWKRWGADGIYMGESQSDIVLSLAAEIERLRASLSRAEEDGHRHGLRDAAAVCDGYADGQFALPYENAEACGIAAQCLASKLRAMADFRGDDIAGEVTNDA